MAFQVLATEIANEDLGTLVRFIVQENSSAAERFGSELLEKIRLLQEHPLIGRMVPERSDPGLREIIHRPYRIVCRVREQHKTVEVLRFWHGARGEPELSR
jgi:plasmid stabilization system protein ParE